MPHPVGDFSRVLLFTNQDRGTTVVSSFVCSGTYGRKPTAPNERLQRIEIEGAR